MDRELQRLLDRGPANGFPPMASRLLTPPKSLTMPTRTGNATRDYSRLFTTKQSAL